MLEYSYQKYAKKARVCQSNLPTLMHIDIQTSNWETTYRVTYIDTLSSWRLIHNTDDKEPSSKSLMSAEDEEVMVGVQGIVLRRDELLPFMDKIG